MKKTVILASILFLSLAFISGAMAAKEKTIMVGAGAGLRPALEPVGKAFTEKTGIKVHYSYLCSAMVLTNMRLTRTGDVLVAGSQHYMDIAIEKDIIDPDTVTPAGYMIPVICVQKGNPKNITCLEDLTKPGIKIGVGEPDALAVGRLTEKTLKKFGLYDEVMKNVEMTAGSAVKLIMPLAMKNLDVVINWLAMAIAWKAKVDYIKIPPEKLAYSVSPIGMTTFSKKKEWSQKYLDFVSSEEGLAIFDKHGFGAYFDPEKIEKVR
ncbi:MAG: molybdate ABC transporter substrate-binding protein [Deltaproteobacteria bacterium]|nr:molybdate ABC transporter substrate-binding protein [Deltaproteobacteria bacterium]